MLDSKLLPLTRNLLARLPAASACVLIYDQLEFLLACRCRQGGEGWTTSSRVQLHCSSLSRHPVSAARPRALNTAAAAELGPGVLCCESL